LLKGYLKQHTYAIYIPILRDIKAFVKRGERMTKKELENRLKTLACASKLHEANCEISEDICICRQLASGIQIHYGIDIIAETMGLELVEDIYRDSFDFPYEYSLVYDGVRFFQINERRLSGYGADREQNGC
jgi:hypothetical protein